MADEWERGERVAYLLHNRQKLTTVRVSQLSAGGVSFWSCYKQAWGFCLRGSCNPKTFPNLDKLQAVLPRPGDFFLPKRIYFLINFEREFCQKIKIKITTISAP